MMAYFMNEWLEVRHINTMYEDGEAVTFRVQFPVSGVEYTIPTKDVKAFYSSDTKYALRALVRERILFHNYGVNIWGEKVI